MTSVAFIFAELALAANVIVWLAYTKQPLGAAIAFVLMVTTWMMNRWATR